MNNRISGNEMTMAHFHDFYFLEALQAGLSMAKAQNAEFSFRRSVEKLETDINETFEKLTHTMALRIYVYIWAASLGEARHADDNCETYIEELDGHNRYSVYNKALNFFPSDENVEILTGIFTQDWNSAGFGGNAWLEIVEGMKLYGKISDAAFIDHTVDLEHNSGSVFTKETRNTINFQCFGDYNADSLRSFLNFKFAKNILQDGRKNYDGTYRETYAVSTKIYNLLVRYSNIIEKIEAINYCNPELEFLTPYEINWDTQTLTITENDSCNYAHCDNCEDRVDAEDCETFNGSYLCDECYNEKVGTCGHCGSQCANDEMHFIENVEEDWCDSCTSNHTNKCDECGILTTESTTTTDTEKTYCEKCIKEHAEKCECGDWVEDMKQHDTENHTPTYDTPLCVDADGIFEIMPDYLEAECTIVYKWSAMGMTYETKTTEPKKQIEIFMTAGAFSAKIKKQTTYFQLTKKTFEINTDGGIHKVTLDVYDVPNSGLFVYNRRMAQYQIGGKEIENEYAVMTPFGLWTNGNDKSLDGALETLYNIKDLIDWTKFTDAKQWQTLPSEKLDEIHKVIYGG